MLASLQVLAAYGLAFMVILPVTVVCESNSRYCAFSVINVHIQFSTVHEKQTVKEQLPGVHVLYKYKQLLGTDSKARFLNCTLCELMVDH